MFQETYLPNAYSANNKMRCKQPSALKCVYKLMAKILLTLSIFIQWKWRFLFIKVLISKSCVIFAVFFPGCYYDS